MFTDNQLTSSSGDSSASFVTKSWLEKIIVVGMSSAPKAVSISYGEPHTHRLHTHGKVQDSSEMYQINQVQLTCNSSSFVVLTTNKC